MNTPFKFPLEERLPPETLDWLRWAGQVAQGQGVRVFLVGGPVRDLLRGARQVDVDLMVEGDAQAFAQRLASKWGAQVQWHPPFLTAKVLLPDGRAFDCATARREVYPRPGALPQVEPADALSDLSRRDFTVNAMAIALHPREWGELLDPHGGREDLERGDLRILHQRSFVEDPTRILRGVRLGARLGLGWEPGTAQALQEALRSNAFDTLSGARLREEWERLFREPNPLRALEMAAEWGILQALEPLWDWRPATRRSLERVPGLLRRWEEWGSPRPLLPWLVWHLLLMGEMADEEARRHAARWDLPRRPHRVLAEGPRRVQELEALLRSSARPSEVVFALEKVEPEWILAALARLGLPSAEAQVERFQREWRHVRPWVGGDDLLRLGLEPGPRFQEILREVRRAQLDGELPHRQAALEYALRLGKEETPC